MGGRGCGVSSSGKVEGDVVEAWRKSEFPSIKEVEANSEGSKATLKFCTPQGLGENEKATGILPRTALIGAEGRLHLDGYVPDCKM
jgi:hypothetical protein